MIKNKVRDDEITSNLPKEGESRWFQLMKPFGQYNVVEVECRSNKSGFGSGGKVYSNINSDTFFEIFAYTGSKSGVSSGLGIFKGTKLDVIKFLKEHYAKISNKNAIYNKRDSLKTYKVNNKIIKAKDEFDAIRKYKKMRDGNLGDKTLVVGQKVHLDPQNLDSKTTKELINDDYVITGFYYKNQLVNKDPTIGQQTDYPYFRRFGGIQIKNLRTGAKFDVNRFQLKDSKCKDDVISELKTEVQKKLNGLQTSYSLDEIVSAVVHFFATKRMNFDSAIDRVIANVKNGKKLTDSKLKDADKNELNRIARVLRNWLNNQHWVKEKGMKYYLSSNIVPKHIETLIAENSTSDLTYDDYNYIVKQATGFDYDSRNHKFPTIKSGIFANRDSKKTKDMSDLAEWILTPQTSTIKLNNAITNKDIKSIKAMLDIINKDIDDYNKNKKKISNSNKKTWSNFKSLVNAVNKLGVKTNVMDSKVKDSVNESDLQKYCDMLTKKYKESVPADKLKQYPQVFNRTYRFKKGGRFYKIIVVNPSGQDESVHSFVDLEGNVYKPASWSSPASGVRTTLSNIINGSIKIDWSGSYLYR